jgi:Trypsin-like peptidase domain
MACGHFLPAVRGTTPLRAAELHVRRHEMQMIARPSIQSLLLQMQFDGQALSTATGFVALAKSGRPMLITNRHNVTGRHQETNAPLSKTGGVPNEVVIVHNRKGALGQWLTRTEKLYAGSAPLWFEHPLLGARADFVALPLTDLTDVDLHPYETEDSGPKILVGPADTVSVVGFPFGITAGGAFAVWATGFLASEPIVNFADLPVQLIDCRSRPGQSGSPVIAYRAGGSVAMENGDTSIFTGPVQRLLGVYSGRINDESDLGIVWKADAIAQLLRSQ